ncbi:hypothetical protein QYM36_012037, partial [Artemia franciscana]
AGANLSQGDNNSYLPMDYVIDNRSQRGGYSMRHICEAYAWGTNANYSIGQGHIQNKVAPELIEAFRKDGTNVKKVAMSKFHSVFLDAGGRIYSCGHGQGGRLGLDSELAAIYPTPIKSLFEHACCDIAVGLDHTVLLMESGLVFSCGSNIYHQLGLFPPPASILSPKQLTPIVKSGKTEARICGVAASRFHTVFWSSDAIFTCGLNAGHLGHLQGEKTIVQPKQVTSLIQITDGSSKLKQVVASEGATLVVTTNGDIYVLHEYQTRRIACKQPFLDRVQMIGGNLDPKAHPDLLKESGGRGLKIVMLSKYGTISVWTEATPTLTRCIPNIGKPISITDIAISLAGFLIVTSDGEGYMGTHLPKRERKLTIEAQTQGGRTFTKNASSTSISDGCDRNNCDHIKLKRIPNVHRAVAVACDIKGTNFCVIQNHPSADLLKAPQVSSSTMREQMCAFFEESFCGDFLHDIIYEVGYSQFAAHKFIIGNRAEYLLKYTLENGEVDSITNTIVCRIDDIQPEVFEQILRFIYTGICQLLVPETALNYVPSGKPNIESLNSQCSTFSVTSEKKSKKKKSKLLAHTEAKIEKDDILLPHREVAKRFRLQKLLKFLDEIIITGSVVRLKNERQKNLNFEAVKFSRKKSKELCDVILVSEEGKELEAHRCVLAARLDYFRSMFGLGWIETSSYFRVNLPLPIDLLEVIIDYLYEDESKIVARSEDVEFICNVIVAADQLLMNRLREICEQVVTGLITLKNVTEVLQFSEMYNASQLKSACMEYICLNLNALFESRALDYISQDLMEELSEFYRETFPKVGYRYITPKAGAPTEEMLEKMFGTEAHDDIEDDAVIVETLKGKKQRTQKSRRRTPSSGNKHEPEPMLTIEPENKTISEPTVKTIESPQQDNKYKWSKVTSSSRHRKNSIFGNDEQKVLQEKQLNTLGSPTPSKISTDLKTSVVSLQGSISLSSVKTQAKTQPDVVATSTKPEALLVEKTTLPDGGFSSSAFPTLLESAGRSPVEPFASLVVGLKEDSRVSSGVSSFGKKITQKLSQKQRKLLAAQNESTDVVPPVDTQTKLAPWVKTTDTPTSNAVLTRSMKGDEDTVSFAEIMKAEVSTSDNFAPKKSVQRSTPMAVPHDKQAVVHSPVKSPPYANFVTSSSAKLSDIIEEEMRQSQNLIRAKSKPLVLTQIEDQAIEELSEFYGVDSHFDERVCVERVVTTVMTPTWFR